MSPRLGLYSSKQVIRVLGKNGFERGPGTRGSHQAYLKPVPGGEPIPVIVIEGKKELPRGTLDAILDRAGKTRDEFLRMVK